MVASGERFSTYHSGLSLLTQSVPRSVFSTKSTCTYSHSEPMSPSSSATHHERCANGQPRLPTNFSPLQSPAGASAVAAVI